MRRRELLLLLGGAVTVPSALYAQQKAMPVIGSLYNNITEPTGPAVVGFRQGLSEIGYIEGQNVAIEYRWAEGHYDRLPALAADPRRGSMRSCMTGCRFCFGAVVAYRSSFDSSLEGTGFELPVPREDWMPAVIRR